MTRLALVLAVVALSFVDRTLAGHGETTRKYLAGLDGVYVLIEDLTNDAKAAGMAEDRLHTAVELWLRQTGVRVLTEEEQLASLRHPVLYVNVNVIAINVCDGTRFVYNVSVGVGQASWLDTTPKIRAPGVTTWSIETLGYAGGRDALTKGYVAALEDILKDFANDYLAANPRPREAPR